MPTDDKETDVVEAGTIAFRDRAFGHVTSWAAKGDKANICLSDGSEWTLVGEDFINKYRALLDLSHEIKKPILLAVDKNNHRIGMIFSTMAGKPQFNGETTDGKQIQVSVPPSMRIFRLRKDRVWFDIAKAAITDAQQSIQTGKHQKFWISFDSVSSEIIDVRPVTE